MKHGALKHEAADDVAVVIQDVVPGTNIDTVTLDGKEAGFVEAVENIPLGHKIAVKDMHRGKDVIEYGRAIGRASQEIAKGAHVHTHNLESIRWKK